MIFKQLFEPVSSTYTYLLGCEETGQAILIDPVLPTWRRDLETLAAIGLRLIYTLDTHIHADHITSALTLKREVGSQIAHPAIDGLPCVDRPVEEGQPLILGSIRIDPIFTPGHTDGHHAYRMGDRVLTGDALLIDACGRTDFQAVVIAFRLPVKAAHRRLRTHRFPERRSDRALSQCRRQALRPTRRDPGLSRSRLRGTLGVEHRAGEDPQPPSRR